ncbi:uncharacterized protein LOC129789130 [Lutzomyia longipalpis]|uniref:uncharacterized protein LOC129789130 n=1 Tax=Lutzomyia longipalpis TaxID=7200 RepID=UPI002483611C|nr:uncharacterized protein LOC129789130 [Lutzomyia longipalpis]XP_055681754.1 uncharacterized protein LOC129789130 [Lutzomyia longipalpis]
MAAAINTPDSPIPEEVHESFLDDIDTDFLKEISLIFYSLDDECNDFIDEYDFKMAVCLMNFPSITKKYINGILARKALTQNLEWAEDSEEEDTSGKVGTMKFWYGEYVLLMKEIESVDRENIITWFQALDDEKTGMIPFEYVNIFINYVNWNVPEELVNVLMNGVGVEETIDQTAFIFIIRQCFKRTYLQGANDGSDQSEDSVSDTPDTPSLDTD